MLTTAKCLVLLHYLKKREKIAPSQYSKAKGKILMKNPELMEAFHKCEMMNDLDGLLDSFTQ